MKAGTSGLATAEEHMMKAIVYREYGSPHNVVELEEVDVPVVCDVEAGAFTRSLRGRTLFTRPPQRWTTTGKVTRERNWSSRWIRTRRRNEAIEPWRM